MSEISAGGLAEVLKQLEEEAEHEGGDWSRGVRHAVQEIRMALTELKAVTAWKPFDRAGELKMCPSCEAVSLEGENMCARCLLVPEDDSTWRGIRRTYTGACGACPECGHILLVDDDVEGQYCGGCGFGRYAGQMEEGG